MRFEIPVAQGYVEGQLALSPNGQLIAYVVATNGVRQIWLRPIGATTPRALPGTDGANSPFWSPDSRSLAFYADTKLKRVDVAGGPVQTIADAGPLTLPGTWNRDGTILFTTVVSLGDFSGAISRVSANGGAVTAVVAAEPADPQPMSTYARMLPDGAHFVYVRNGIPTGTRAQGTLYVASLEEPAGRPLFNVATDFARPFNLAYASGFLLFLRDGALLAQRFDAKTLASQGDAVPIAENVADFSVAENGTLVYREWRGAGATAAPRRRLVWLDRAGKRLGEVDAPASYSLPSLSADGRRIALTVQATPGNPVSEDIWTVDAERGVAARLTFDDAADEAPIWSPDGARIVFGAARGGLPFVPSKLYQRAANGAGTDELLFSADASEFVEPLDWSRDGRFVLFVRGQLVTADTRVDIWVLPMTGDKTAYPLLESPFRKSAARFSPDGKWVAYGTNESNGYQVVVRPFPEIGQGQWQVSTRGGYDPRWRGDGRELYYLAPDGTVMAVDVQAGDAFETGAPHALFATGISLGPVRTDIDYLFLYMVTADGQRFLINEPVVPAAGEAETVNAAPAPAPINVIVNWTSGIGAR
jgi:Tol biopolymer transport system component